MKIAIFYATREGQARRIAERLATTLRERQVEADLFDMRTAASAIDWASYRTICLAASVHAGHHEREAVEFAKRHRAQLADKSAAFVSVTLSEAGAEDPNQSYDRRLAAAADAQRMVQVFADETGWKPAHAFCVAGALAYTHYNFLERWVMKRIARKAGAPTDTSRDYEFTDWTALDEFAGEVIGWAEREGTVSAARVSA